VWWDEGRNGNASPKWRVDREIAKNGEKGLKEVNKLAVAVGIRSMKRS